MTEPNSVIASALARGNPFIKLFEFELNIPGLSRLNFVKPHNDRVSKIVPHAFVTSETCATNKALPRKI